MSDGDRAAERSESQSARERARRREAGGTDDELPAGLERGGRDENLVHGPDAHPSGARADHRHSVPGTSLPGGPGPAAAAGEEERVRAARDSEGASPGEEPVTERAAADEQADADAVENPAPPGDDAPTG